jgi:hypothetical protein
VQGAARCLHPIGSDQLQTQALRHRGVQRIRRAQPAGVGLAQRGGRFQVLALDVHDLQITIVQHRLQTGLRLQRGALVSRRAAPLVGRGAGEFGQRPAADPQLVFAARACAGRCARVFMEEQRHQHRGVEVGRHRRRGSALQ